MTQEPNSTDAEASEGEAGGDPQPIATTKTGKLNRQLSARWIVLTLLISMLIAANWPLQYSVAFSSGSAWSELPFDFGFRSEDALQTIDPVEAGWPFRYYIRHSFPDGEAQVQWFGRALGWNLAIAALFVAIVLFCLRPSARKSNRLSLADLLFVVTLIGAVMGYWRWQIRQSEADKDLADKLSSYGQVLRQAYMPAVFADRIPASMRPIWQRTTAVNLQDPSDEQLQLACKLPYLRSLRIGGGRYDTTPLRRLPSMRYLQDVRIAGAELDGETVLALSQCSLIGQLNISHTNIASDALPHLAKLPRLSRLMAMETMIPFQAWQQCDLKNKLEVLVLSRPRTGTGGEIRLESWPKLRHLTFQSFDEPLNASPFAISLHDMSQLEHFGFDSFQFVDLDLQRLPKLAKIQLQYHNTQTRMADNDQMPYYTWVRRCVLKDLPSLDSFRFYVRDFESIDMENCDAMTYLAGCSRILPGTGDATYDRSISRECIQRVIDQFGKLTGPPLLSLRGCDLQNVDFAPLKQNSAVATLDFQNSSLAKKSADEIASLSATTIDLRNAEVGVSFVNSLSSQMANLESLLINSDVNAIRVEDKPKLETIIFDQHKKSQITALRLINVPELRSPLVLSPIGNYLHVESAPKLSGLAVLSLLPEVKISGVAGLKWFVGGGAGMNDEAVSEVLKAEGLTELTIAYPSASSQSFNGVPALRSLKQLALPGAALDNDLLQTWQIPETLTELDLRDCGLSAATTRRIIARGRWERLLLRGNTIDVSSLSELQNSPSLFELSLSGITVNKQVIDAMGPLQSLMKLDLAGATIEPGGFAAIADTAEYLTEIDLTGASADWSEIAPAIRNNSLLKFRLSPVDATVELITKLTVEERLVMDRDAYETWFQPSMPALLGYDARGLPVYEDPDRDKGPSEFERPDWSTEFFRPDPDSISAAGTTGASNAQVGAGTGSVIGQLLQSINLAGAAADDIDNSDEVKDE
ncbi:hypothetical protein [Stieleria mannarensis]|uniref:hypothetical protein n=1 Tax=Stieleria mannarensis TaxID=2755585 RepID=UPI001603308F|nr:hypothetical protein [Rhodopirellula sp. JC639]